MIAVITPLSGQTSEQLRDPKTLNKIERLASTLMAVANDPWALKTDLSFRYIPAAVKSVLKYQDVQARIAVCSSKLNLAMNVFQISWLYGLAGTVKSTIAHTIAEYRAAAENLGVSFFFSRDQADRVDGRCAISTIAYQLTCSVLSFQPRLVQATPAVPDAHSLSLQTQLMKLIRDSLHGVTDVPSLVAMVLDALNKCSNAADAKQIVTPLASAADNFPPYLRPQIAITSRPEVHLDASFTPTVSLRVLSVTTLHNFERSIVKADIKLYLQMPLQGANDIATDDQIDRLVEMAQSLLIVVSTTVAFVHDPFYNSLRELLEVLLSVEEGQKHGKDNETMRMVSWGAVGNGPSPYLALNEMYWKVLSREADRFLKQRLRSILGAIVHLLGALPLNSQSCYWAWKRIR
ncbi:hypothetical protein FRB96_001206 [Tulasnella sp. 330]|nr:hypothetical protein FRB96_001206 [Tulasnella sp. 330]